MRERTFRPAQQKIDLYRRVNLQVERECSAEGVMDGFRGAPDGWRNTIHWMDEWKANIGLIPWRLRTVKGYTHSWKRIGGVHVRFEVIKEKVGIRFTCPVWADVEDKIHVVAPKWNGMWKEFRSLGEELVFCWDDRRVGMGVYEWMRRCWIRTLKDQEYWMPWRPKQCSWRLYGRFGSDGGVETRWDGEPWPKTLDEWTHLWEHGRQRLWWDTERGPAGEVSGTRVRNGESRPVEYPGDPPEDDAHGAGEDDGRSPLGPEGEARDAEAGGSDGWSGEGSGRVEVGPGGPGNAEDA